MYAIVEIAGKQFKVTQDSYIYTPTLDKQIGASIAFNHILLVQNEEDIQIGSPFVVGATVEGKILGHVKGDKVIVFKKKRRKGYTKKQGHRQGYTKVLIENILK